MKKIFLPRFLFDLMASNRTCHADKDAVRRSISVEEYPDTIFDLMATTKDVTNHFPKVCSCGSISDAPEGAS